MASNEQVTREEATSFLREQCFDLLAQLNAKNHAIDELTQENDELLDDLMESSECTEEIQLVNDRLLLEKQQLMQRCQILERQRDDMADALVDKYMDKEVAKNVDEVVEAAKCEERRKLAAVRLENGILQECLAQTRAQNDALEQKMEHMQMVYGPKLNGSNQGPGHGQDGTAEERIFTHWILEETKTSLRNLAPMATRSRGGLKRRSSIQFGGNVTSSNRKPAPTGGILETFNILPMTTSASTTPLPSSSSSSSVASNGTGSRTRSRRSSLIHNLGSCNGLWSEGLSLELQDSHISIDFDHDDMFVPKSWSTNSSLPQLQKVDSMASALHSLATHNSHPNMLANAVFDLHDDGTAPSGKATAKKPFVDEIPIAMEVVDQH